MSCCAEWMMLEMFASAGEVCAAYTWGLSEILKPGGMCEAFSHLCRNSSFSRSMTFRRWSRWSWRVSEKTKMSSRWAAMNCFPSSPLNSLCINL